VSALGAARADWMNVIDSAWSWNWRLTWPGGYVGDY
jgi:hypothetical protein